MFKFFFIQDSICNCKSPVFSLCNLVTFMPKYDGNVLKNENNNLPSEIFLSNFALSPQLNPKWILDLVACHKALGSVSLLIYLKINALVLGKIGNNKSKRVFNSLKGPSINDDGNFSVFFTPPSPMSAVFSTICRQFWPIFDPSPTPLTFRHRLWTTPNVLTMSNH